MKRIGLLLTLVAVLAFPGAALAQGGHKGQRGPGPQACVKLRAKLGGTSFRAAYAAANHRRAFGKCVRDQRRAGQQMRKLALGQCRSESNDDPGADEGDDPGDQSDPGDDDSGDDESGDDSGDDGLESEGGATLSLADCVANKLKRLAAAHNERFAKAAQSCKRQLAGHRKGRIARRGTGFARCVRAHMRAGGGDRGGNESQPGDDDPGADPGEDEGDDPGDGDVADEPGDDSEE